MLAHVLTAGGLEAGPQEPPLSLLTSVPAGVLRPAEPGLARLPSPCAWGGGVHRSYQHPTPPEAAGAQ